MKIRTLTAAVLAGLVVLTACGGTAGGAPDDGTVTLRFSWWGSDARHERTQQIIDEFEAANPGITIQPEFGEFGAYWDRLATQVASNDAPDIIQMDEKYLREYADRGALLELSDVDTSTMTDSTVATGTFEDGVFGVPTGINAMTILANPTIFANAGVELPDDTTWTWDDYSAIAQQIAASGAGYGATSPNEPATFQIWLRQNGREMTDAEGNIGFTPQDAAAYLQLHLDMLRDGAYPAASVLAEDQSPGPDQSLGGTGQVAMSSWWTNQVTALSSASGQDMIPLRMPSSGTADGAQMFYKSSMFMSGSARTEHPEEVLRFIDHMVNSSEAGAINLADRGIPANLELRDEIAPQLQAADQRSAEFLASIEGELGPDLPVPPLGFSALQEAIYRYQSDVFFEAVTPEQAGQQMYDEMIQVVG